MRLINRIRELRYCAFCRSQRTIYVKKHVDATNVVLTLALAIGITSVVYGGLDPHAALLWPALVIGAEIFIYLRWRASLTCTLCGFDPIAYKRSPAEAAHKVGVFFNEKMNSTDFMLSRSPLLAVYKEMKDNQRKMAEYERVMKKNQPTKPLPREAPKGASPPSLKTKGSQVSRSI